MNEKENENIKETKQEILKNILSEVSLFANSVKSLELNLYEKEQAVEAAKVETFLEKESDQPEAVPVDETGEEIEEAESEEEGSFFKIIKNALGFIVVLLPLLFANFDKIKKMFGDLPDIMKMSFKDIILLLFKNIQKAIDKYVFTPIGNYLKDTVSELWRSLVLSVEETFVGVISSLPTFLKDNLPDIVKELTQSAADDIAKGKDAGKQPEVQLTVGSTGSFGATESAQFGGEYKPPEYGTPAPPPPKPVSSNAYDEMIRAEEEAFDARMEQKSSGPDVTRVESGTLPLSDWAESQGSSVSSYKVSPEKPSADAVKEKKTKSYGKAKTISPGTAVSGAPGTVVKILEIGPGYNVLEMEDGSIQKRKGDRNWRNNNPGNISYGDFAKGKGAIGTDGRFAIFPTYEMGRQAKIDLIFKGSGYRNLSLKQAIYRYAPPNENDSERYYQSVLSAVGGEDKQMSEYSSDEQIAIVNTMQKMEGFRIGSVDILQASEPETMVAEAAQAPAIPAETAPASTGSTIAQASQEVKASTEEAEEQQQQIVVQTAMASQPMPQIENTQRMAGAGVGSSKAPANAIQRSYSDYFAVA